MESFFIAYIALSKPVGYGLLALAMILEGDAFLFLAGFLVHQGLLDPLLVVAAAFPGVLVGDALWYLLGKRKYIPKFISEKFIDKIARRFDEMFSNNPFRTFLMSKFVYNAHHPLLLRLGMLKVRYREIFRYDIGATLIWGMIVGGLGYLSSASFTLVKAYLRFLEIGLFAGLVLFLLLEHLVNRLSRYEK